MAANDSPESLTPLEQEVLDEYALLLENLNKVSRVAQHQRYRNP